MRIYLIRHGQTLWNSEGRAQGHTNVDIDHIGLAQSRLVAQFFDRRTVHRVLTSDLKRCLNTAQATAELTEVEPEITELLRERSFGELEGQHYTVIRAYLDAEVREKKLPRYDVRPRGGESISDAWERVIPFVKDLTAKNEDTVIFSHGGTMAILLAQILGATLETAMGFRFENSSITEVKRLPIGYWQLVRYNDTRHLDMLHEELPED